MLQSLVRKLVWEYLVCARISTAKAFSQQIYTLNLSFGENGLYICWFKIRVWCMLKGRKTSSAASVGIFCWFVILIRTHIICHHFEFYLMQLHVPFILLGLVFRSCGFFLSLSIRCHSILSPFSICLLLMFSPYALGSQYSLYFIIMWFFLCWYLYRSKEKQPVVERYWIQNQFNSQSPNSI